METEEHRVRRRHEGVVHLEVADLLDPAPLHVVEHAALGQGQECAAVTVRTEQNLVLRREDEAEIEVESGDHALSEEMRVLGRQAEAPQFLEVVPAGLVGGVAGHDVPGERSAVPAARGKDALGVNAEERSAGDRADREGALRAVEAQARALAAGDGYDRDVSGPEQALAGRARLLARGELLRSRRKPDVVGQFRPSFRRRIEPSGADVRNQRAQRHRVHRAQLADQPGAPARVQFVPPAKHVALARIAQRLHDFRIRPLVVHVNHELHERTNFANTC